MKYFTPKEVGHHHKPSDAWLIVFGRVYNVTPLIEEYGIEAEEIKPILMFAGKDVSHWFDEETEKFTCYTDIATGQITPFSLHGIPPHVVESAGMKWWQNQEMQVGKITKQTRQIRIINTIIDKSTMIECCTEDTFQIIKDRYAALGFNIKDDAYAWVSFATDKELDPDRTLDENGITDESKHFEKLCMPSDYHTPSILLFYKDVITPPLPCFDSGFDLFSSDTQ